ncbi:hypothetical protein CROQUDRAFT_712482 [Cronartium quercuum f. sp. fusiforme G11]|uniref:UBZ4-type domain-containing protein n=1 Tax=Cronartium quercuum f. sp. fusiforme G11 TaxID=708437 RepID=A0A9P6TGX1_9BASI|nr:hypothetical protein CROQUDRAFT_712482 [Cronartium quercuum f. sp. fusiforme G11]
MEESDERKPVLTNDGEPTGAVDCPICHQNVSPADINRHLDEHLHQPSSIPLSQSTLAFTSTSSSIKRKASNDLTPSSNRQFSHKPRTTPPIVTPSLKPTLAKATALRPLAERVQPTSLDQCVGPSHLLGKPGLLHTLIQTGTSLILWGPPGCGKTTLARSLAGSGALSSQELSGTDFGAAEWRKILTDHALRARFTGSQPSSSRRLVVFVDEAHRLSKTQQDLFLPHIDSGEVLLILATTENPSFKFANRLMSRCRMVELPPHTHASTLAILQRACKQLDQTLEEEILTRIASFASGDARVALGQLEILVEYSKHQPITLEKLPTILGQRYVLYDRNGDCHYDMISALHKSVRGSDPDAALYWLARMLEGGEDPLYVARRLVRMASEDIGAGNPHALTQAVSAFQATQLIGMPEADTILAQVVVMLAESPKSVRSYRAYKRAKVLVGSTESYAVPIHLRNAPTKIMKELGYGAEYKYEPEFSHPVAQDFWPAEIGDEKRVLLAEPGPAAGESVDGKRVDWDLLKQWELARNGGKAWDGRKEGGTMVVKAEPGE